MYQDFKDKTRARRRSYIEEIGSVQTIGVFWIAVIVGAIGTSAWFASQAPTFAPEFLDWCSAILRILLPVLIALSIAGPIARRMEASGSRGALFVLVALGIAISMGLIFAESKIPSDPSVSSKKAAVYGVLNHFRRGGN
jgi:uncharacterized membrane protein YhaH (DUF805 family)